MKPDASKHHNPDPAYIRSLVERTGLKQSDVVKRLDITKRSLQYYMSPTTTKFAPYLVQFALESMAKGKPGETAKP